MTHHLISIILLIVSLFQLRSALRQRRRILIMKELLAERMEDLNRNSDRKWEMTAFDESGEELFRLPE